MAKVYNFPLLGLQQVQANLNRALAGIVGGTKAGLLEGGLLIQRRSQELTPVDTGTLKASHETEGFDTPKGPVVVVKVQAGYAIFVEEDLQARHKPPGQAKFLETAVKETTPEIISIVAARAKIS